MRRIPVAVTAQENSALNWLQHFATKNQLPEKFHALRKQAAHKIIKTLSASEFVTLIDCFTAAENPTRATPTP